MFTSIAVWVMSTITFPTLHIHFFPYHRHRNRGGGGGGGGGGGVGGGGGGGGGGGTGGMCPPQPAGKGGSAPTARAMPIHAVLGLTMRYHMKFQE